MTVKLELMTDDPEEKRLAVRYWAMSETGEFLEKVIDLVPFRHVTHSGNLASHVRQLCRAFDQNLICPYCNAFMEVKSRSMVKKQPQKSYRPCPECEEILVQQKRKQQAQAAEALELQLSAYIDQLPSGPISYAQLSDDEVLLLLALDFALSPRLTSGSFLVSDCKALAPMDIKVFIDRLRANGIIREDPRRSAPDTYFLRDGKLMVNTRYMTYTLAPDVQLGRSEEAMQVLLAREFSDTTGLFNLWLDFACADAMRYLQDKCEAFDHQPSDAQLDEIKSTLRTALKTHSVSQIWFVIWKNIKDAASLARLVYYTEARATATIPGKIRRTLERIEKEGTLVRKWDRPDQQPAGTLGMLFNDLFGIDEDTPGVEVLKRLTYLLLPDKHDDGIDVPHPESVRQLLCNALVNDNGPQMMHRFAALIREGHDIGRAITALLGNAPMPSG